MSVIREKFGANFRTIRKNFNLTQKQLGQLINVNERFIIEIEKGKNSPSDKVIEAMCKALNISAKEFFDIDINYKSKKNNIFSNYTFKGIKFNNLIRLEASSNIYSASILKYNNKILSTQSVLTKMISLAVKVKQPVVVDFRDAGETFQYTVYFPDGSYKHLIKKISFKEHEELRNIYELINDISKEEKKLQFVRQAICASYNKQEMEKLKFFVKGMDFFE